MNTRYVISLLALAAYATLGSMRLHAADTGGPVYAHAQNGGALSFIYERYERDVEFSTFRGVSTGPGGTFDYIEPGESGKQEEDRILGRLSWLIGTATLHVDVGMTDSKESEGYEFMFGGGFRVMPYQSDTIDISLFANGHYVPRIKYKASITDFELGRINFEQDEKYWEASAGMILSRNIPLDNNASLAPYGGFMLSIFRGDVDITIDFPDLATTAREKADLDDDGIFSLLGGVALHLDDVWSARVEGRFINQSSISVALTMAF